MVLLDSPAGPGLAVPQELRASLVSPEARVGKVLEVSQAGLDLKVKLELLEFLDDLELPVHGAHKDSLVGPDLKVVRASLVTEDHKASPDGQDLKAKLDRQDPRVDLAQPDLRVRLVGLVRSVHGALKVSLVRFGIVGSWIRFGFCILVCHELVLRARLAHDYRGKDKVAVFHWNHFWR